MAQTAKVIVRSPAASTPGVIAPRVELSEVLAADHLMLVGERIDILVPMQGATKLTTTAEELRAAMMAGNQALGFGYALDRAVAAVYPG